MKILAVNDGQPGASQSFDLFRLSKSKDAVDVCANTLRTYNEKGLPFYRCGKAVFVSRAELANFIRTRGSAIAAGLRTLPQ
jgi:hypothetical protein